MYRGQNKTVFQVFFFYYFSYYFCKGPLRLTSCLPPVGIYIYIYSYITSVSVLFFFLSLFSKSILCGLHFIVYARRYNNRHETLFCA